jgi:carbamoyltransferase
VLVLGWHGNPDLQSGQDARGFGYHDAAAALVKDGEVIAAIEEERLTRSKHCNAFPAQAIRFCLSQAKVTLDAVDAIVTDCTEAFHDFVLLQELAADARQPARTSRELIAGAFEREFGIEVSKKLQYCKHHLAHLCTAWYPSGFDEALVVCWDGDGDGSSGLIAHGTGEGTRILRQLSEAQSLGNFYTEQLAFLGYRRFDEYKVMGLAPYGDPKVFAPLFGQMYELQAEGRYALRSERERLLLMSDAGLARRARRKGEPFTREHMDYAAALQWSLERIGIHLIEHFQHATGARRLCLSGGVAHNCALNGKLLAANRFEDIYVQPAAHDAGNALGAALHVCYEASKAVPSRVMPEVCLGTDVGSQQMIERSLRSWNAFIEFEPLEDAPLAAARRIAAGEVIAWVQGRSEFGPRALGNRSILADPRPAQNRQIINSMVKKREDYRPFAPSVLEECLHDYFEVPATVRSLPYMSFVMPVRPQARSMLGAITHVDGSARVQSVSRQSNPRYYALIEAFGSLTGLPIVLNTSFNNDAEPIVDSIDDAVVALLTTRIHALIIGDWLVRRRGELTADDRVLDLEVSIAINRKLVHRPAPSTAAAYALESTAPELAGSPVLSISPQLFTVLSMGGQASIRSRLREIHIASSAALIEELVYLWEARALVLRPSAP